MIKYEAMLKASFAFACALGFVCALFFAGCSETPAMMTMPDASMDDTGSMDAGDAWMPSVPFNPGPYGTKPKDIAGPFTVPTTDGDWDFQKSWTGDDSYVFLVFAPGYVTYPNGADYSKDLFKQSLNVLLPKSPQNVHYFFLPLKGADPAWPATRDNWINQVGTIGGEWPMRVHFIDTGAMELPNWIGDMMKYRYSTALPYKQYDYMGFAIDRFQRIREVGMLGQLVQNGIATKLNFLAFEPQYYEFEWAREKALAMAPKPTVVTMLDKKVVYDTAEIDVVLPDAQTMATFDTLEVDLAMDCDNHRDGECGAWDYLGYLWVCEGTDPDSGQAICTNEIARWITSYWRETRWVTDISQMLPLLKGGMTHFRWNANGQFDPRKTNYTVSLNLRLSNKNKGMRPISAIPLYQGGNWDATYDMNHPPIQKTAPNGKKTELYVLLTGHGGTTDNCAEFCNHEHHFSINGSMHTKNFPEASTPLGCTSNVGKGTVPNQHGTWYYGRGGWCPGYDVAPWVTDVSGDVKLGQQNDFAYTTSFNGMPVDVNRGYIVLSSYLITWQ